MSVLHARRLSVPSVPTIAEGTLLFHEIRDARSLREHFRLRYLVYRDSGFLPPCLDEVDIDAYDLYSRFLGAWRVGPDGPAMVGGVRMVHRYDPSPLQGAIRALLRASRDPVLRSVGERPTTFPSEKAFDLGDVLETCDRDGLQVVEFSRTVCHPAWRGLQVGFGLVNGVHAMALREGIPLGIGSTPPKLRDFYARQGCRILPTRDQYYADLSTDAYAMLVDLRRLEGSAASATRHFMAQLARHGSFQIAPGAAGAGH